MKEVVGSNTDIKFSEDGVFSEEAGIAEVGIAIVGESPYAEGWGDNSNPTLSAEDVALINRLKLVSEKVVVVLVTGRPLIITQELEDWDALVVVWLPGSEGAGVADVLFGKKEFTGTLPLPWPASISQLPIETDGSTNDGSRVLFERYFGL
jgi:beta-glucosidase